MRVGGSGRSVTGPGAPFPNARRGLLHARVLEGRWGVIPGGSSGFYLMSLDEAAWIDGARSRVDGGEHVSGATS